MTFRRQLRIVSALARAQEQAAKAQASLNEAQRLAEKELAGAPDSEPPPSSLTMLPPSFSDEAPTNVDGRRVRRVVNTLRTNHADPAEIPSDPRKATAFNPATTAAHAVGEVERLLGLARTPAEREKALEVGRKLALVGVISQEALDRLTDPKEPPHEQPDARDEQPDR